jgi:hypothetical protein
VCLERCVDTRTIETNNDVTVNIDDWDTALARFVDGFLAGAGNFFDVFVGVCNT